jgi:hypothetical protein
VQEVPEAVRKCQQAGILVRMITGDNVLTAKSIAREIGILTDGASIEGPDFRKMTPEEQRELLKTLQVPMTRGWGWCVFWGGETEGGREEGRRYRHSSRTVLINGSEGKRAGAKLICSAS